MTTTPMKEEDAQAKDAAARAELDAAFERSRREVAMLEGCRVAIDHLKSRDRWALLDRLRVDEAMGERVMSFYARRVSVDVIHVALALVFLRQHIDTMERVLDLGAGRLAHHLPAALPGVIAQHAPTSTDLVDVPPAVDLACAEWSSRTAREEVAARLDQQIVRAGTVWLLVAPPFDEFVRAHPLTAPVRALAHRDAVERRGFRLIASEPKFPPGLPGFTATTLYLFRREVDTPPQTDTKPDEE